jgi:short-subunit dehydrogenase
MAGERDSVRQAVGAAGPIDVLVNNAGIGLMGALEGALMATVQEVFETNDLGTNAMTQAMLPQFRQRKAGVIVNVTSSVTLKPLPLLCVYNREQGRNQRVHEIPYAGTSAVRCASETGDIRTVSNPLR